jgi:hypothetical protein
MNQLFLQMGSRKIPGLLRRSLGRVARIGFLRQNAAEPLSGVAQHLKMLTTHSSIPLIPHTAKKCLPYQYIDSSGCVLPWDLGSVAVGTIVLSWC